MLIIAERINSTRKSIAEAVESNDTALIQREAMAQAEAGADYIDVNAGTFINEEADRLKWLIRTVQEATDLPLCIDSPDPKVIEAAIPLVDRTPMINSITLEPARLEGILPLVAEHKTKVVGLCQADELPPDTAEGKLQLAGQLVEKVTAAGVALDDLYIDALVYPIATNSQSALATIDAIERIMKEFPGVHTTCGLTNVSYGMPNRKLINRTFLAAAITRGLDSAILDPTDKRLFGTLKASLTILAKDEFCLEYIEAFRAGRLE